MNSTITIKKTTASQQNLGMVRGVEKRLVGLGLSFLQQLGGLAQQELW